MLGAQWSFMYWNMEMQSSTYPPSREAIIKPVKVISKGFLVDSLLILSTCKQMKLNQCQIDAELQTQNKTWNTIIRLCSIQNK